MGHLYHGYVSHNQRVYKISKKYLNVMCKIQDRTLTKPCWFKVYKTV